MCGFTSPPVGFSKRAAALLSTVSDCGTNQGIELLGLDLEVCDACTKGLVALPHVRWYTPVHLLPHSLFLSRRWVNQFVLPMKRALRLFNFAAVLVSLTECAAAQLSVVSTCDAI